MRLAPMAERGVRVTLVMEALQVRAAGLAALGAPVEAAVGEQAAEQTDFDQVVLRPQRQATFPNVVLISKASVLQHPTTTSEAGANYQYCRICRTRYTGIVCPTCALVGLTVPVRSRSDEKRYRAILPAVAGALGVLAASYLYGSRQRRVRPQQQTREV